MNNPYRIIGNIFSNELMDYDFQGDVNALNFHVKETILTSRWLDKVVNSDENAYWIAWEAFISWIKIQLSKRSVSFDDDESFREFVGVWFSSIFGDHHTALQLTVDYINNTRNAIKEDTTMKNTEIENIALTEEQERFCAECGCVIEGEGHEVDDVWYCDDCFEEHFVVCAECGELIRIEDAREFEGDYYCEECFDDNFQTCDYCGTVHRMYDMTWVESEGGSICEDCLAVHFTRCDHCGEYVRNYDVYGVYVDEHQTLENWCECCAENDTWICEECEERYSDDVEHDEDCICPRCSGAYMNTGDIENWISPTSRMGYHYKPTPCMCATEAEKAVAGPTWARDIIFGGFELEIDREIKCNEEDYWSGEIVKKLNSTYCKTDCSLDMGGSYSGIEIVSHPATLAWYMEHKQDFVDCFDMLKKGGWLSHDAGTCGLHIHISLHALEAQNPFAVHNMLILYDRFWNKLVKFSRRTNRQLDHWAKKYSTAHGTYNNIKNMAKRERDRYMAVNLQNSHTVEIRMFRGTLNPETFFATLQLVDVITKKCVEIGNDQRRVQSLTWEELIASDYEELNAYLARRGLLEGSEELPEPPESDHFIEHLEEGMRVRAIAPCDRDAGFIGREGTIEEISHDDTRLSIFVRFDNGRMWWCERSSLEIINESIEDQISVEEVIADIFS